MLELRGKIYYNISYFGYPQNTKVKNNTVFINNAAITSKMYFALFIYDLISVSGGFKILGSGALSGKMLLVGIIEIIELCLF